MKVLLVAFLLAGLSFQARGQFGAISDAFNTATDAISNTANDVADAVTSATDTAVDAVTNAVDTGTDAVSNAVDTGTNAVSDAAQSGVRTAQHVVDTSENWISNTVDTATSAVVNFTQDQWDAAGGVADDVGSAVSSFTGSAVDVGRQVGGEIRDVGNSVTSNGSPPAQGIDATDPAAILAALNGPEGFRPFTTGILQAIAAGRSANLADATAAVIVNASTNQTTQTQIAQAFVAAMGVAQNDTDMASNSTAVAEVFMASLQNAIVPCASGLQPQAEPGTAAYTQAVADSCCSVIDRALTTAALVSDLINVDEAFYAALDSSDAAGSRPQLNLGKCVTDQTEEA